MRQRSRPAVPDDAAVVDDFLKLGGGFLALSSNEIRLAANVCRIEAGKIDREWDCSQLKISRRWQAVQSLGRILPIKRQLRSNCWQPERWHLGWKARVQILCQCNVRDVGMLSQ
jgi:hypothetical protein